MVLPNTASHSLQVDTKKVILPCLTKPTTFTPNGAEHSLQGVLFRGVYPKVLIWASSKGSKDLSLKTLGLSFTLAPKAIIYNYFPPANCLSTRLRFLGLMLVGNTVGKASLTTSESGIT